MNYTIREVSHDLLFFARLWVGPRSSSQIKRNRVSKPVTHKQLQIANFHNFNWILCGLPVLQMNHFFVSNVYDHGLLIFLAPHIQAKDWTSKKQAHTARDCLFPTGWQYRWPSPTWCGLQTMVGTWNSTDSQSFEFARGLDWGKSMEKSALTRLVSNQRSLTQESGILLCTRPLDPQATNGIHFKSNNWPYGHYPSSSFFIKNKVSDTGLSPS
jgi:hypothetical protein